MSGLDQSEAQEMYEMLKRLWMLEHKWDEDEDSVERRFDLFVSYLVASDPVSSDGDSVPKEPPSLSSQLMELILEIDSAMTIVPPRVAKYRQLLADAGLDKQPATSEEEGADSGGSKGMPGITLADQAALAFHGHVLGIALGIAQDEASAKLKKRMEED